VNKLTTLVHLLTFLSSALNIGKDSWKIMNLHEMFVLAILTSIKNYFQEQNNFSNYDVPMMIFQCWRTITLKHYPLRKWFPSCFHPPNRFNILQSYFVWNSLTLLLKSGLAISRVDSQLYLKTALPMDLLGSRMGPS
jgi:hypothetical protein